MGIKHLFQSAKADGADATLVRPSNWNADHDLTDAPFVPNLVLNSDFGRRTRLGLAMPEACADTSGMTAIIGSVGSVASNALTAGTASRWQVNEGLPTWCDGRWSASVKQVGTATNVAGLIGVGKSDGTNWATGNILAAGFFRTAVNTVTLVLYKTVAGAGTTVASQAGLAWTDGHFGWVELEVQGDTCIARLYTQGGTAAGVKSSATLLKEITGTVTDTALATGALALFNDTGVGTATIWGGVATGNGGVYVETWLPESLGSITFTGGGMALGYDDAADSGPLGKQWALTAYVPATSRTLTGDFTIPVIPASTGFALSQYVKSTSLGGAGVMARLSLIEKNTAGATQATTNVDDAAEVAWTRKSGTVTTNAATTKGTVRISINPATTRTGIVRIMLPQLEQGSAATAWRNAPADDGVRRTTTSSTRQIGSTAAAFAEIDSRDLALNHFSPYDETLDIEFQLECRNGTTNAGVQLGISVDGSTTQVFEFTQPVSAQDWMAFARLRVGVSAGKHRIAVLAKMGGGSTTTFDFQNTPGFLYISATRGK